MLGADQELGTSDTFGEHPDQTPGDRRALAEVLADPFIVIVPPSARRRVASIPPEAGGDEATMMRSSIVSSDGPARAVLRSEGTGAPRRTETSELAALVDEERSCGHPTDQRLRLAARRTGVGQTLEVGRRELTFGMEPALVSETSSPVTADRDGWDDDERTADRRLRRTTD